MSDHEERLAWRECEVCFRASPQDALEQCHRSGAWHHDDCPCECDECIEVYGYDQSQREHVRIER